MKTYKVKFYRNHQRLLDEYVTITIQARDLEAAVSRVKKELQRLQRLPNPLNHSMWMMQELKEEDDSP